MSFSSNHSRLLILSLGIILIIILSQAPHILASTNQAPASSSAQQSGTSTATPISSVTPTPAPTQTPSAGDIKLGVNFWNEDGETLRIFSPGNGGQAVYGGDAIILFSDNQTWLYQ